VDWRAPEEAAYIFEEEAAEKAVSIHNFNLNNRHIGYKEDMSTVCRGKCVSNSHAIYVLRTRMSICKLTQVQYAYP
jgi:hypothetical protein